MDWQNRKYPYIGTQEDVEDREILRLKIHKWLVDEDDKPKKKTGTTWFDDRKEELSRKMREIWAEKERKRF